MTLDLQHDVVSVPNGGFVNVQPPLGESWHVVSLNYPANVTAQLHDGTNTDASFLASSQKGQKFSINNDTYLRFTASTTGKYAHYAFHRDNSLGSITDILTVPASSYINVQPPGGQVYVIDGFRVSSSTGIEVGYFSINADESVPIAPVHVSLSAANREMTLVFTSHLYLRIKNTSGSTRTATVTGRMMDNTLMEAGYQVVVAGASVNIQPAVGDQKVLLCLGYDRSLIKPYVAKDGTTKVSLDDNYLQTVRMSVPLTDTLYLRYENPSGVNAIYTYAWMHM